MRYCPVNERQVDPGACDLYEKGFCGLCEGAGERQPRLASIERPWERSAPVAPKEPKAAPKTASAEPAPTPPLELSPRCRICGCTESRACPGGCWWAEPDLCSACVGKEAHGEPAPVAPAPRAGRKPRRPRLTANEALRQVIREGLARGDRAITCKLAAGRLRALTREDYVDYSVVVLAVRRRLRIARVYGQDCLALDAQAKAFAEGR